MIISRRPGEAHKRNDYGTTMIKAILFSRKNFLITEARYGDVVEREREKDGTNKFHGKYFEKFGIKKKKKNNNYDLVKNSHVITRKISFLYTYVYLYTHIKMFCNCVYNVDFQELR